MGLQQPTSLIGLQSKVQKIQKTLLSTFMRRILGRLWVIWQKEKETMDTSNCSYLSLVNSQLIPRLLSRAINSRIMVKSDCSIINSTRQEMWITSSSIALPTQIQGKLLSQNNWKKMTSYSNHSSPRTRRFQLQMSRWIVIMNVEKEFWIFVQISRERLTAIRGHLCKWMLREGQHHLNFQQTLLDTEEKLSRPGIWAWQKLKNSLIVRQLLRDWTLQLLTFESQNRESKSMIRWRPPLSHQMKDQLALQASA